MKVLLDTCVWGKAKHDLTCQLCVLRNNTSAVELRQQLREQMKSTRVRCSCVLPIEPFLYLASVTRVDTSHLVMTEQAFGGRLRVCP